MRHILCFGNPLHGDDGFGPAVYQRLAALPVPADLKLIDAGTPGLAALAWFKGCDEVIIVDALAPAEQPGKLYDLTPDMIEPETEVPGHGIGVGYLLRALQALAEPLPAIRILAAEASAITPFSLELSAPVALAVDQAVARLKDLFQPL